MIGGPADCISRSNSEREIDHGDVLISFWNFPPFNFAAHRVPVFRSSTLWIEALFEILSQRLQNLNVFVAFVI